MYEILFSSASERFFKKIKEKPLKDAYKKALLKISENPYIGQPKRGDLAGIYGFDVKYQGKNYEIAYTISEFNGKKVIVLLAGTRENFYAELKRYIK
ncbi:MAG: type II toxin-antitoxin system RelE/ParE family toxin [Syntrophomonadaceae bacterium]|nr:type II toxin-antitoxin system RelE/ParE family toxin [Syntrophomonadaceae bacterium]MDD3888997.1 type II toxin-antitoxin system RelE/ParE family toxin [Syntrophomonadaceae bacterium]MDD4548304.1 type II toxin-antitoxin system RelE/ParE family toxin [Syntrophomonadaceae bacterium]